MKTKPIFILLLLFCVNCYVVKAQHTIRFVLVNADTDTDIRVLTSGDTVNYSNTNHISIRVDYAPDPAKPQAADFIIDGDPFHSENVPPYCINGDRRGDILPYEPLLDSIWQSITVKMYRYDTAGVLARDTIRLFFENVSDGVPGAPSIDSFILVNADTDEDMQVLHEGDFLYIDHLPALNLRVTGNIPSTGSVIFNEGDNLNHHIENKVPYAMFGDLNGDYFPGYFGPVGYPGLGTFTMTIKATPYTGPNGSGISGTPAVINIIIVFGTESILRQAYAYPNPSSGPLQINVEEEAQVQIYDLTGKVYYEGPAEVVNKETLDLDRLRLPDGAYYIRIIYNDKSQKVLTMIKN